MDSLRCKLTYISILLAALTVPCFSDDCDFPAVFNFGDSNSDTGGWSATFGRAGSPAGETYFHQPAGRYCDGRLIIDFIGIIFFFSSSNYINYSTCFFSVMSLKNSKFLSIALYNPRILISCMRNLNSSNPNLFGRSLPKKPPLSL